MAKKANERFKPIGTYTPMTEAEIAAAAEITEEDKAAARAMWRRHAPPKMRRLLDAKPRKTKG